MENNLSKRFEYIDSLRGIAALLVILLHVSEKYINISPITHKSGAYLFDFIRSIDTGRIGVVIFFAISGFVLLESLKKSNVKASQNFVIKRFFRLYPIFWLSIALAILTSFRDQAFALDNIFSNATMLPQVLGQKMLIGTYWTLEIELFFYGLVLLLFSSNKLHKPINIFSTSFLFLGVFYIQKTLDLTAPTHIGFQVIFFYLSLMFWGGMYRKLTQNPNEISILMGRSITTKTLFIFLTLAVLSVPLLHLFLGLIKSDASLIRFGISNILGIFIFLACCQWFKINNIFSVWLGKISYSMYLFHPLIFYALYDFLLSVDSNIFTELHLVIYILINVVLTIFVSSITYVLIEKPMINLSLWLTNKSKLLSNRHEQGCKL